MDEKVFISLNNLEEYNRKVQEEIAKKGGHIYSADARKSEELMQAAQKVLDDHNNGVESFIYVTEATFSSIHPHEIGLYRVRSISATNMNLVSVGYDISLGTNTSRSTSSLLNISYSINVTIADGKVKSVTTSTLTGTMPGSLLLAGNDYSVAYMPTYDGSPATKKYVDDAVAAVEPIVDMPSEVITNKTTMELFDSLKATNPAVGSMFFSSVTLTDMPEELINAEIEVKVYPDDVYYATLLSADTAPYQWTCNNFNYQGWIPAGSAGGNKDPYEYYDIDLSTPLVVNNTTGASTNLDNEDAQKYIDFVNYMKTASEPVLLRVRAKCPAVTIGISGLGSKDSCMFAYKVVQPQATECDLLFSPITHTNGGTYNGSSAVMTTFISLRVHLRYNNITQAYYSLTATTVRGDFETMFLGKANTTSYTPTGDYNPATKKYVDDNIANIDLSSKQDTLTAGANVHIDENNVISAADNTMYFEYSEGEHTDATTLEFWQTMYNKFINGESFSLYTKDPNRNYYFFTAGANINRVGGSTQFDVLMQMQFYSTTLDYIPVSAVNIRSTVVDGEVTSVNMMPFYQNPLAKIYGFDNLISANKGVLAVDNTYEFTPTENYNPATKKYVDDAISSIEDAIATSEDIQALFTEDEGE